MISCLLKLCLAYIFSCISGIGGLNQRNNIISKFLPEIHRPLVCIRILFIVKQLHLFCWRIVRWGNHNHRFTLSCFYHIVQHIAGHFSGGTIPDPVILEASGSMKQIKYVIFLIFIISVWKIYIHRFLKHNVAFSCDRLQSIGMTGICQCFDSPLFFTFFRI